MVRNPSRNSSNPHPISPHARLDQTWALKPIKLPGWNPGMVRWSAIWGRPRYPNDLGKTFPPPKSVTDVSSGLYSPDQSVSTTYYLQGGGKQAGRKITVARRRRGPRGPAQCGRRLRKAAGRRGGPVNPILDCPVSGLYLAGFRFQNLYRSSVCTPYPIKGSGQRTHATRAAGRAT